MTFSVADLKSALTELHNVAVAGIAALQEEFDEFDDWLNEVEEGFLKGNLASTGLLPKTPGKRRGLLGTINESVNTPQQDGQPDEIVKKIPRNSKKKNRRKRKPSNIEEDNVNESIDGLKRRRTDERVDVPAVYEDKIEQRLTRTTIMRETVVIEKYEAAALSPPVLRSPSPIDVTTPEPVTKFKSPQLLKPRAVPPPQEETSAQVVDEKPPPLRMTRTKTRAMAKAAQKEPPKTPPPADKSSGNESEESETTQPSFGSTCSRLPAPDRSKPKIGTPLSKPGYLSHSQIYGTPSSSNIVTGIQSFLTKPAPASVKKDRHEDYLMKITQKTNEAQKKKEELIKAQTEEKIKKRQEKELKVNAAREAMEKERAEKRRQQMALEEEKQKQEAKRRKLAQQKAAEAAEAAKLAKRQQEEEQRRLVEEKKREQEEQRRLAEERKREQERIAEERRREEEERRRLAEEKKRELEEKKKIAEKKRQLEEQRRLAEERKREQEEAERRKKEAEKAASMKVKAALASAKVAMDETYDKPLDETFVKPGDETFVHPSTSTSYVITPMPEDRKPAPSKSVDDYGIEDAGCDDSSEDESNPKKEVPAWAQAKNRMPHLINQYYIRPRQVRAFFGSKKTTPDLNKIFPKIDKRILIRKSSAVWRSPLVNLNESIM